MSYHETDSIVKIKFKLNYSKDPLVSLFDCRLQLSFMSVKEAVKEALQGVLKRELRGANKETIQGANQDALQSVL